MPTTLTGDVDRVTYENEETGFRVVRIGKVSGRGPIVAVGRFPAVGPGTHVRVTGEIVNDARHGEQLRVETLVPVAPDTLAGLEKYLGSGMIPGVGPGFAKRIVETFGMETLKVLDENPERLTKVPGLGGRRADEIRKKWASQHAISSIMLVLQSHGASPALAARIHQRYGERAAQILQQHPYRLALDVRGVGFKTADRIARSLGIAGDHPERAQAGTLHVIDSLSDQGHVTAPREAIVQRAAELLEIDEAHVEAAVDSLWAANRIVVEDGLVFPARLHAAEVEVVAHVRRLLDAPARPLPGLEAALSAFEQRVGVTLAPEQRRAVDAAARQKLVVVTGGPGVGKTTIVRAILSVLENASLSVRLAAPTGRAAKRLGEATGRRATTLHRLLEYDPRLRRFTRNEEQPVDADAFVVDEASMIDLELGEALLAAVPSAARLVLVGDSDQLPSVGPGAVLRDLIDSGVVPTERLARIFRQAEESRIVVNAHAILRSEMPESASPDDPHADFFIVQRSDPEQAARTIVELVTQRIPKRFALNPRDDVQVLTPMHRGPAGTQALNAALQAALNPDGRALTRRGIEYRVGDKVMQTKNDYEREVYNGDIGVVQSVDPAEESLLVRFDERDVEYEDAALDQLTLAYAISIHKSQGSEYPAVVVPFLTAHFVMLSKNLVYTAVTRAKRLCVLVADPRALRVALGEAKREERMTRLTERLRASR
ncbi:MAG TPA: ATP-dependent RecD-like DNA helicase [Polyangiaceae bacterium]|nr:ATP-dependent RecD-like DNA helicase [Polyangiaceae bacterium]